MQLGIIIAQLLLQYGPELAGKFAELVHSDKEPTLDDWRALLKQAATKTYDDYVPKA